MAELNMYTCFAQFFRHQSINMFFAVGKFRKFLTVVLNIASFALCICANADVVSPGLLYGLEFRIQTKTSRQGATTEYCYFGVLQNEKSRLLLSQLNLIEQINFPQPFILGHQQPRNASLIGAIAECGSIQELLQALIVTMKDDAHPMDLLLGGEIDAQDILGGKIDTQDMLDKIKKLQDNMRYLLELDASAMQPEDKKKRWNEARKILVDEVEKLMQRAEKTTNPDMAVIRTALTELGTVKNECFNTAHRIEQKNEDDVDVVDGLEGLVQIASEAFADLALINCTYLRMRDLDMSKLWNLSYILFNLYLKEENLSKKATMQYLCESWEREIVFENKFQLSMARELVGYLERCECATTGKDHKNMDSFIPNKLMTTDVIESFLDFYQRYAFLCGAIITSVKNRSVNNIDDINITSLRVSEILLKLRYVNTVVIPFCHNMHFAILVIEKGPKNQFNFTIVDSLSRPYFDLAEIKQGIEIAFEGRFDPAVKLNFSYHCTKLQPRSGDNTCGMHAIVYSIIIARFGAFNDKAKHVISTLPSTQLSLFDLITRPNLEVPKHSEENKKLFNYHYREQLAQLLYVYDDDGKKITVAEYMKKPA